MLHPTPPEQMVDADGRPHFLWDVEMTLVEFQRLLAEAETSTRAYLVGKLMRQAKPDDVFEFVTLDEVGELWPELQRYLGNKADFWEWILGKWEEMGHVQLRR